MQELDRDEATIRVSASPEEVYSLVSDITRTPEFSPEVLTCNWLGGATSAAVGARFEAMNKARRGPSWKNQPMAITAEPGSAHGVLPGDPAGVPVTAERDSSVPGG